MTKRYDAKKKAESAIEDALQATLEELEANMLANTQLIIMNLKDRNVLGNLDGSEEAIVRVEIVKSEIYNALREAIREGVDLGRMTYWAGNKWTGGNIGFYSEAVRNPKNYS